MNSRAAVVAKGHCKALAYQPRDGVDHPIFVEDSDVLRHVIVMDDLGSFS